MIVEEKKAADRICPQMISATPEYRWCLGSRCMAWRWRIDKVLVRAEDPEDVALEYYTNEVSTTHGFCGLAGRP